MPHVHRASESACMACWTNTLVTTAAKYTTILARVSRVPLLRRNGSSLSLSILNHLAKRSVAITHAMTSSQTDISDSDSLRKMPSALTYPELAPTAIVCMLFLMFLLIVCANIYIPCLLCKYFLHQIVQVSPKDCPKSGKKRKKQWQSTQSRDKNVTLLTQGHVSKLREFAHISIKIKGAQIARPLDRL